MLMLMLSVQLFANQTSTLSPIHPEKNLPFRITIVATDVTIPDGIQGGAAGHHDGKWLFLAGRTNGLHGFDNNTNNFPIQEQNRLVYVVDMKRKKVTMRSLTSSASGLNQAQIDSLSVTAPQSYQKDKVLYMTGGYGIDTQSNTFTTKDILTAIDIPDMIDWVERKTHKKAVHFIRQIANPIFQITGGYMNQFGNHPTLLVFGQTFTGTYIVPPHTQVYSEQVRRFRIYDNGKRLKVKVISSTPKIPDPNFRRRDLNVIPVIQKKKGKFVNGLVALSGVFTPEPDNSIWTVPVEISANGKKVIMPNPNLASTFKQGMNNYFSATVELFSKKEEEMYSVLLGGITYQYFQNGALISDSELPFTNQVTTIKLYKNNKYKQYIMDAQYPTILSTTTNPGNTLLFGANARFIPVEGIKKFSNKVIKLDALKKKQVIGYIVGGIASTVPNTSTIADSIASPYIFEVILEKE